MIKHPAAMSASNCAVLNPILVVGAEVDVLLVRLIDADWLLF